MTRFSAAENYGAKTKDLDPEKFSYFPPLSFPKSSSSVCHGLTVLQNLVKAQASANQISEDWGELRRSETGLFG